MVAASGCDRTSVQQNLPHGECGESDHVRKNVLPAMLNEVQQIVGASQKGIWECDIAIELIKTHVLNRLADAAEPFEQVMVDKGSQLHYATNATAAPGGLVAYR